MTKPKKRLSLDIGRFSKDQLLYVKSLVQSPVEIGQVTPSSRFLADGMVAKLDLANARAVVEFGPGTGSVTRAILDRCGKQTTFFAMETNAGMVTILQRRFPNLEVVHDSAEHIGEHLKKFHLNEVDYIVSSLPFALLSPGLTERILTNAYQVLKPGGAFVTYQYLHARVFKSVFTSLRGTFNHINTSVVFRNLPPAFVFQCAK